MNLRLAFLTLAFSASQLTAAPRLFTLPREKPWRFVDGVPAVTSVGTAPCGGTARPGEFFVFQLGVVADEAVGPLSLELPDLKGHGGTIPSSLLHCLSLGGTGSDGKPLAKSITVPAGGIQVLWCGVDVPTDAKGSYTGSARLSGDGRTLGTYALTIRVEGDLVADHGDREAKNLSRLRWLDSTVGGEPTLTRPFVPVEVRGRVVRVLGRELEVGPDGLPAQALSFFDDANTRIGTSGRPLLAGPASFVVDTAAGAVKWTVSPGAVKGTELDATWTSALRTDGLSAAVSGRLDYTGSGEIAVKLTADRDLDVKDIRLVLPWREDAAKYFMGLGHRGGARPAERVQWAWDVKKRQDCFWMGDVNAGLMLRFKDDAYVRPLVNIYYGFLPLRLPASWGNEGKGGVVIEPVQSGSVVATAASGPRLLRAGEALSFVVEIYLTPFRALDTEKQWATRFVHPHPSHDPAAVTRAVETMDAKAGPNVLNIHQAQASAPYINYPYADDNSAALIDIVKQVHAKGCRARVYYTTRELTQNLPELHALHSLNGEVIFPGPGAAARTLIHPNGPHQWLVDNLGTNFVPAWVDHIRRPGAEWDLSVITRPDSRWNNFYLEGLQWLAERMDLDGVYIDDTALDARSLQRARRILDRKPGRLMDLHSWNHMNGHAGFANNLTIYMEILPYLDRLWLGEGFSMSGNTLDFVLVEMSGLPFGLMSEMLDGANPWRGLVFGETARLGWSGDTRSIWKAFDDYGIQGTEFLPFFSARVPVKTGRADVPATVYRGKGRSLVAIGSWADRQCDVVPQVDWAALGLAAERAAFYAPAIAGFQSEALFKPGEPIPVGPGRGWLFVLDETPRKVARAQDVMDGAVEVFRDNFTAPSLADGWRVVQTARAKMTVGPRTSALVVEGPANRHAGIERALPAGAVAVEAEVEPDTDAGQTWGVGLALAWANGRTAKINWRVEDKRWGTFAGDGLRMVQGPSAAGRARNVRVVLGPESVLFQVQDGERWQTVDTQSRKGLEGTPSALRVGKLAEDGAWEDFGGDAGKPGRCQFSNVRVLGK